MQNRYAAIDGLRGIAAIAVVMFHAKGWFGAAWPARGYVAVDLFFVLSGFVIAASYEHRLRAGMTLRRFFLIRAIRLFPLYLIGLAAAVLVLSLAPEARDTFIGGRVMDLRALPFALLALPSPLGGSRADLVYPLNFPAWSLFFEFAINILYALTWRRWTLRLLPAPILVSGLLLIIFGGDGDKGWAWEGFPVGMLRCLYAFPFGVLIFRLRSEGYRAPAVPGLACLAAFGALLLIPAQYAIPVAILAGAPLTAAFAASATARGALLPLFSTLGLVSYALYALHIPLINATRAVLFRLNAHPDPYAIGFAFLAAIIPLCFFVARYCDDPIRAALTSALLGGRSLLPSPWFAGLRKSAPARS